MSNNLAIQQHQENQVQKMTRLDDSLFSPTLSEHYEGLAHKLAKSGVIPKQYIGKPLDLFVAMAMGYQLGMPVEQAIQDIAVINGRPCIYGDGLLAVVMNHADFEDIIEQEIMNGETCVGYTCTVKRKGKADYTKTFTIEMAKRAGLLGKPGPWAQYPDRMMQMRARGFALRDRFPDALRGIKSREEVEDYIDGEVVYKDSDTKPLTQVERVKQSYLTRIGKGLSNENDKSIDSESKNIATESETNHDSIPPVADNNTGAMAENAAQEGKITNENSSIEKASKDQVSHLEGLLFINDIPPEKIRKTLNKYGVALISELSCDQANELIENIKKKYPDEGKKC